MCCITNVKRLYCLLPPVLQLFNLITTLASITLPHDVAMAQEYTEEWDVEEHDGMFFILFHAILVENEWFLC